MNVRVVASQNRLSMRQDVRTQTGRRSNTTEPGLRHMLVMYLKERGIIQMSDLLPHSMQGMSH